MLAANRKNELSRINEQRRSKISILAKMGNLYKCLTIAVGLMLAFAGNSIFFEMHNNYTKDVFLNENDFQPNLLELKNWLFGVIGGTIVGFHVLMVMISENSFKKQELWAYKAMWCGLLSWFIIDSGISI